MEELVGKIIQKIRLNENDTLMVFNTSIGERIAFQTEGDCCSSSWFSHISGLDTLIGNRINEVFPRNEFTEEEQAKAEAEGSYESLTLYGFLLITDKGTCDVEFRNDSNGYYGGWCEKTSFEEKALNQEYQEGDLILREIKEDF